MFICSLVGFWVLDLIWLFFGLYFSLILVDLGVDVIKIELFVGGDWVWFVLFMCVGVGMVFIVFN